MKILIATLLCAFTSSVHSLEFNSSLLETKGRGQTRHASSYVFTLWYQRESNKIPQVFCGAAYLTKEKLITLDWCAQKIDEAIKEHNNLDYFRYSATVAPIENLNQKKLLEIKEVYVRQDVDSKPNLRGFAVIKLEKKMKLSGIDKFEWGNYDKQVGTGFFTHGYQHYMDYARTLLDVKNVNLKMQPFGWRQANIGYQIYERCTTPENKNDDSYRPERGSPLFYNEKLVGICSKIIIKGNPKYNCDTDIYLYILPEEQDTMFRNLLQ